MARCSHHLYNLANFTLLDGGLASRINEGAFKQIFSVQVCVRIYSSSLISRHRLISRAAAVSPNNIIILLTPIAIITTSAAQIYKPNVYSKYDCLILMYMSL